MASGERKRQEKLARKSAKRKQHNEALRRSGAGSGQAMSAAGQIAMVSRNEAFDALSQAVPGDEDAGAARLAGEAPLHGCLVPAGLFESGIGTVVVSRKLTDGRIVAAVFLLDVWCLGVKDA